MTPRDQIPRGPTLYGPQVCPSPEKATGTFSDAEFAYLRSVDEVAVEILREHQAVLVADLLVAVQGATVNTAENMWAIERQIAGLTAVP